MRWKVLFGLVLVGVFVLVGVLFLLDGNGWRKVGNARVSRVSSSDLKAKQAEPLCNTGGALRVYGVDYDGEYLTECECLQEKVNVVAEGQVLDANWEGCIGDVEYRCYRVIGDDFSLFDYMEGGFLWRLLHLRRTKC
jgi:hypothetical protein